MLISDLDLADIKESIDYIKSVGPASWKEILDGEYKEFKIEGDDLNGMIYHLYRLGEIFGVPYKNSF